MNRRGFLRGIGCVLAAPSIVRVASLMPVKVFLDADKAPMIVGAWSGYSGTLARELTDVTRRAFVPGVQVQIYDLDPLLVEMAAPVEEYDW